MAKTDIDTQEQDVMSEQEKATIDHIQSVGKRFIGQGICERMHAVMASIDHIDKDGFNEFHRYAYTTERAIKKALRDKFIEHSILASFEVLSQEVHILNDGKNILTCVSMSYKFIDITTGENISGMFQGQGIDTGDKGLYKAITGGLKYCLSSNFLIPTGDDPEAEEAPNTLVRRPGPAPIPRKTIAQEAQATFDTTIDKNSLQGFLQGDEPELGSRVGGLVLRKSSSVAKNPDRKYWFDEENRAFHSWYDDNPEGDAANKMNFK